MFLDKRLDFAIEKKKEIDSDKKQKFHAVFSGHDLARMFVNPPLLIEVENQV